MADEPEVPAEEPGKPDAPHSMPTRGVDISKATLADALIGVGRDYQDCWNATHDEYKIGIEQVIASHVSALSWLLALDNDALRTSENIMKIAMSLPAAVVEQRKRNMTKMDTKGSA